MDTMTAFRMGEANRGNQLMVFDWDKAARLIVDQTARSAAAGLEGDWDWTGGDILSEGKPVAEGDTYVYLASTWAQPQLEIDGETVECWRWKDENCPWTANTVWPESALAILNAGPVTR